MITPMDSFKNPSDQSILKQFEELLRSMPLNNKLFIELRDKPYTKYK